MRRIFLRSAVVAVLIALITPSLWFIVSGESHRTPTVSKSIFEKMTPAQIEEWKRTNFTRVSVWEHARRTPYFISENWVGYLEASAVIFVAVFGLNIVFHLVRGK